MPKRRVYTAIVVIILLMAIIAGATLAYLTDVRSNSTTRTVGNVQISLTGEGLVSTNASIDLQPGSEMPAKPLVKSNGKSQPCYVRLEVTIPADLEKVIEIPEAASGWVRTAHPSKVNTYYYTYQSPLATNSQTTEAFSSIKVPATPKTPTAGLSYHEMLVAAADAGNMLIVAEAIQTAPSFSNAQEAFSKFK